MRVILVGCGQISSRWLDAVLAHDGLELVGLVDPNESAARATADSHRLSAPIYASLAAALSDCQADLVFDCSPPTSHPDVTMTALSAGLHVFGEKPMAEDMDLARAMVDAAAASDTVYAVMQNRRYDPNIRAVRDFLRSGAIGEVTTVAADFYLSPHFGGFREDMGSVLLLDMAIHTFDAARMLIDANAATALCHEWNPKGSWYRHGASAVACFEMTNGAVFSYRGSWCAEGLHTTWESAWRFIGDKGSLTWDGAGGARCQIVDGRGEFINRQVDLPVPRLVETDPATWHTTAINAFVASVIEGVEPETRSSDNFNSLAMVHSAVDSAAQGRRISLESGA